MRVFAHFPGVCLLPPCRLCFVGGGGGAAQALFWVAYIKKNMARYGEDAPEFYAYATFVIVTCAASSYLFDMCGPDKALCKGMYAMGLVVLLYVVLDTLLATPYHRNRSREYRRRVAIQIVLLAVVAALLSHRSLRRGW